MSDRRERNHQWWSSFDEKRMMFIIGEREECEIGYVNVPDETRTGDYREYPAKYEVCETCDGKGKHVNPSIDAHGISREEFDEDPDFAESYMRGDYDMPCNECNGRRVAPVLDESRMTPQQLREATDTIKEHYDYIATCEAERRMGA